ncbi:MAG: hypothetical protein KDA37_14290 [Planctomycetales bacterium]|nr:hypothetical protein [Planctomycetales bacterium]
MPAPSSPFDEGYEDHAPPRRKRRAWWRWNIVALFVALFLLVWVRELLGLSPLATWLSVLSVFALWAVTPAPFALATMPDQSPQPTPPNAPASAAAWRNRNGVLVFFKVLAIVFLSLGLLHLLLNFVMVLMSMAAPSGWPDFGWARGSLLGLNIISLPMVEIIGSALTYLLAEIAMRLDRPPWESRHEN